MTSRCLVWARSFLAFPIALIGDMPRLRKSSGMKTRGRRFRHINSEARGAFDHATLEDWKNVIWSDVTSVIYGLRRGGEQAWRTVPGHDDSPQRYKARWVAKGFTQRRGVDFDDTYASVVKPSRVKALLTIAVVHDWDIRQFDITTAFFLHADLDRPVYIRRAAPRISAKGPKCASCEKPCTA